MTLARSEAARIIKILEGRAYRPKPGAFDPHPTMDGITQHVYDAWRKRQGLPVREVYGIEPHEWEAIFDEGYWRPSGADRLPPPLAIVVADSAFNHGTGTAVKQLQRAVGTTPDGVIGPKTIEAARAADPVQVAVKIIGQRIRLYRRLHEANPKAPLVGWLNRMTRLQAMVGISKKV